MVILGDRWETLCAATAAACARIPIAHIHGGESTWGAMDDSMRHAISKLSHIHCVANVQFAETLSRMGEKNIYITGAPGLDNLRLTIDEGPRKPGKYFVCTYHPETLADVSEHGVVELIAALEEFPDYFIYWTGVNNDPGNGEVSHLIENCGFGTVVDWSLGEYLRRCRHAAAVIGNSSSGIIEAPYLGVPSVNIGDRQAGRPMGPSVIQAEPIRAAITTAILFALDRIKMMDPVYPELYGSIDGNNSEEIAKIISSHSLDDILKKPWHI
jgi:UDP-hydrolysing UDP-N-acetyl-D-glucosamine 2-epimerase